MTITDTPCIGDITGECDHSRTVIAHARMSTAPLSLSAPPHSPDSYESVPGILIPGCRQNRAWSLPCLESFDSGISVRVPPRAALPPDSGPSPGFVDSLTHTYHTDSRASLPATYGRCRVLPPHRISTVLPSVPRTSAHLCLQVVAPLPGTEAGTGHTIGVQLRAHRSCAS